MIDVVYEYRERFHAADGREYRIQVRGAPAGNVWHGWLIFLPLTDGEPFETDRETTQSTRDALAYWATGLEPLYFEGAFERARRVDHAPV